MCCRRCGVAGGERVPPAPLGWYFDCYSDWPSLILQGTKNCKNSPGWWSNQTWSPYLVPPTKVTELHELYTWGVLNIFCPKKKIFVIHNQNPFITEEKKILKRTILREYEKRGKSLRYFELKTIFNDKKNNEASKYEKQNMRRNEKRKQNHCVFCTAQAGRSLSWRGAQYFHYHVDRGLSAWDSAEMIANNFSSNKSQ